MKLNLKNVRVVKKETDDRLFRHVCNYVIGRWQDYEDKTDIFKDVLYHGCQSGIVGELVYYSDTTAFYKNFRQEINELLGAYMNETGIYDLGALFGKRWDTEDPLATDVYNQNLLAWFGFEETLRNIGCRFEDLREHI